MTPEKETAPHHREPQHNEQCTCDGVSNFSDLSRDDRIRLKFELKSQSNKEARQRCEGLDQKIWAVIHDAFPELNVDKDGGRITDGTINLYIEVGNAVLNRVLPAAAEKIYERKKQEASLQ
jgi:hypothetical protein